MAAIDDLPPLREVIARHELMAKKALGQNFLFDLNLTARIARATGPLEGVSVLEVGPGPGGLTRALLASGAKKVVAIERDERCLPALAEIAAHYPGRLEVISGDALETDMAALIEAPARICANLPYNISTALLTGWLTSDPWPPWFESLTLMFQREVAERIVAPPGSKTYGRLSVLSQWRCEARIVFDVAPSNFFPPPKIMSSIVKLVPRTAPFPCAVRDLERLTAAAFGQRRKMLRASLKALGGDVEGLLAAAGIAPTQRAEQISVEDFARMARLLPDYCR